MGFEFHITNNYEQKTVEKITVLRTIPIKMGSEFHIIIDYEII